MDQQRRGSTHVTLDDDISPRELLRVQRLARELRLTDQILSNDLDTLSVEPGGPAPAWTTLDGDKVSFNYAKMPKPFDRIDIAVWLGTNAHELGHVLFSPRRSSTLMFRVIESDKAFLPGIATMHNIVEDQRQERLLLARFSPWTGYLTAALGHHLVADDNSAWLLMAGRTWLPASVRETAKARMVAHRGQRDTDEVTRIVGEYQRLTDPGDTESDEAWELLQELHTMFADELPKFGSSCTVMTAGDPDTDDPDGDAPLTADEADVQSAGGRGGDGDDDDGDDDGDDGDGDGDGEDTDTDDDDDDAKRGDGGGGGGAGAGNQPRGDKPFEQSKHRKALKRAAEAQIDRDDDAKDDLDSIAETLEYGRPGDEAEGADAFGSYQEVTDEARLLYRDVADALLDLKDDSEPGWNRRVESGRLNVRRLLNPNVDADELFDRYEPGMMDASELEAVLLVDVSGSMGNAELQLGEAVWAIRHAVDDLDGTITVITYDSVHRLLAGPGVRPDGRMFVPSAQGGTMPKTAIREAFRLLTAATAKNRLFIIMTDGDWYTSKVENEMIAQLGSTGVATVFARLGGHFRDESNLHGCQYGASIDEPAELARLFRTVAAERISAWL